MLVSIYFPFSDFRSLLLPDFQRLKYPNWPSPDMRTYHVRGIGSVRRRRKSGFEGWVGEDQIAIGGAAIAILLSKNKYITAPRVRLVRKACYFDGLVNGRIEFLFSVDGITSSREAAIEIVTDMLNIRAKVSRYCYDGELRNLAPTIGMLWSASTVKHGDLPHADLVKCGRPICVVESDYILQGRFGPRTDISALPPHYPNIELSILSGKPSTELLLIWPRARVFPSRMTREHSRALRTYTLRLLQNVEALSMLLNMLPQDPNDATQNVFNEYTRQINRSRLRVENYSSEKTINYCYSTFSRIFPGRTESVRSKLISSKIRPSIAKKLLQLLDFFDSSNFTVMGDFNLEKNMAGKFEDITISGSQGITFGDNSPLSMTNTQNQQTHSEALASALDELAKIVSSQTNKADQAVETSLLEAAARKAKEGDEEGAAELLKKSASWVLELGKSAGSAVLTAFLKSHLGV